MTSQAAFNAEDWSRIVTAPALTAMLVLAASRGGSVRESIAMSRAYASAREQDNGELLDAVLASPPGVGPGSAPRTPDELRTEALDTLRRSVAALERSATDDEVVAYKRFVYAVADAVARAHREGGFLGIGGTEVSEAERAVLDEIEAIFDQRQSG